MAKLIDESGNTIFVRNLDMRCGSDAISNNMADHEDLTDAELAAELELYGEKVAVPIKRNKRPILLKKLNHLKARAKAQEVTPETSRSKHNARSPVAGSSRSPPLGGQSPNKSTPGRSDRFRSYVSEPRARPSNLEALSSDDSDVETPHSAHLPTNIRASTSNHIAGSARDKKRPSQFSDSVYRTLRRRTAEPRSRTSNVVELSTEKNNRNDSMNDGSEDEIPVPSPARSKLYPDLSKFTSFLSKSHEDENNFESSDSDFEVENKSANTSFPFGHYDNSPNRSHSQGSVASSKAGSSSFFNNSASQRQRSVPWRRQNGNGPHRVQQYKSRYIENLPQILVGIAILFFVVLSATYVVIHKDYFFSWITSSNNMGSGDHVLLCTDGLPGRDCYGKEEVAKALDIIRSLFTELSIKKGHVLCDVGRPGDDIMLASSLKDLLYRRSVASTNAERMYECCLDHIIANPNWKIRALREDGSVATTLKEVAKLESEVADMTLWCRLQRSFSTVLYGISLLFICIVGVLLISMYIKYRLKQREVEQREVYIMVEKIIDYLQDHHEQTKGEDSDEPQYLAVQHVRDQLLPPSERRRRQPIWDKAVEFIAANESRIRLETRMIHGDEFEVWHWLQPSAHNGKMWQGQAFGENNNNNNSNQVIYSPTPCLKIRNMFDSNVESEENWEDNVTDAILEKCKTIPYIVHVYVDVDSREGCVYLKCSNCEAAGKARLALHGWWFDGRLVTVKHLKTDHYHKRWPEARNATKPLKPSTDQMRSLSQPFYRSSLEMT